MAAKTKRLIYIHSTARLATLTKYIYIYIYIYISGPTKKQNQYTGVGSSVGGKGGKCPPLFYWGGGGGQWYVCAPLLLTPHFYFPLVLYVDITLTNNYLAFFIYQLIILWTISIN